MQATRRSRRFIKQGEIEAIIAARLEVETLDRQLKQAREALDRLELIAIARLEAGEPVEPGPLALGVNVQPGRRVPRWKEEFARLAGPDAVEQVIQRTEPGPPTKKLVVLRDGQVLRGGGD